MLKLAKSNLFNILFKKRLLLCVQFASVKHVKVEMKTKISGNKSWAIVQLAFRTQKNKSAKIVEIEGSFE